ncbi:MAG: GumC family protein [Phormidesmis sp.]
MTSIQSQSVEESEFGYGQLLQILGQRIYWLGGALVASLGVAVTAPLLLSPTYQSSMQLLVEPNVSRSISINEMEGSQSDSSSEIALDYATQLTLMRSKEFVEDVVIIFPDICQAGQTQKECMSTFQNSLRLSQIEEDSTRTRVFEAVFTGNDARRAQKSLQALQHVYLQYNENQQERRLKDGLMLVNRQIDQVQQDINDSQEALKRFRQTGEIIDPERQSLEAAAALEEIEQTQQAVQADYQEAQARYEAVQQALSVDPEQATMAAKLSESGRYQALLEALQLSELELSARLAVYTLSDPIAQDLQAQRDRQVDLLQIESQRLLGADTSASQSELIANGQLGERDLELIQEMITTQIQMSGLVAREASLSQTQQSLQQQLSAYPRLIAEYDRLQPEVETQRAALEELLQTRQELSNEIAQGGFKWAVVEAPDLGRKISPIPSQNLALGIVAGLFLGGLLAYGREATDTVVHTPAGLKKQTALPLLGVLPKVKDRKPRFVLPRLGLFGRSRQTSISAYNSSLSLVQWQPFREVVDLVYKNIQLAATPLKSVMVTSAVSGEGKTTLAMGLALSAARSQKRVLLIDADLRRPSLHEQIGLSNRRGLTMLLDSLETPIPVSITVANTQIDILSAGPFSEDPVQLLNSHRMRELVAKFEQQYDLIVFDASAVLGQVDALQIASLCQGVVMVSRLDRVTQSDLSQTMAILARVNQLGIVANGDSSADSPYTHLHPPEPILHIDQNAAPTRIISGRR